MHRVYFDSEKIRTDLILEEKNDFDKKDEYVVDDIKVTHVEDCSFLYTTIYFQDLTDRDSYLVLQKILVNELKKYIKVCKDDIILVLGMGNKNSTPDSLGPSCLSHVLVTRYLYAFGDVDSRYSNVSIFQPDVFGNTGVDSISIIELLIKELKPTKVIVVDALKANHIDRLTKTIQITNRGINPGSGISNNRGEISSRTLNCDVIAIGVPTVLDLKSISHELDSFIVTPTNIDFVIEKLSSLIGNSLNLVFHQDYFRQI